MLNKMDNLRLSDELEMRLKRLKKYSQYYGISKKRLFARGRGYKRRK